MAVHNDLRNDERINIDQPWEGLSGKVVEDAVTRKVLENSNNIITGGEYNLEKSELILTKKDGTSLPGIRITVAEPTYDYSIIFYGIRVNGTVYDNNTESILTQYINKDKTKVEAGIAIRSVAQVLDNINNNNGQFEITFEFNGNKYSQFVRNISKDYFVSLGNDYVLNFPEGVSAEDVVAWVDITTLFNKKSREKQIKVSFTPPGKNKLEAVLNTKITNEIINLIYRGNVIIKENNISLQFENDTTFDDYDLVVFINNRQEQRIKGSKGIIEGLDKGLNQIVVRAEHTNNNNICTNWLNFDVIYTEGFNGTAISVNGVSSKITNNGVATLYKLFIYSTSREEIELTTYLEDAIPDSNNPNPTQIIKSEFVQASSYNRETNATEELNYKKYIEVESSGTIKYLLIKYNSAGQEHFYMFKTPSYSNTTGKYYCEGIPFKQMEIEQCNSDYTYVKNYNISKNYDQITGQINNLFSTSLQSSTPTLIPDLESSDGWKERDGITYLKLSKQGKSVLVNDIDLSLNDNFTIELGFKTYNVSDKAQSILNIGKLTLYPTQIGWEYNEGITSTNFLKRNAQFQEGQDTHIVVTVTKGWTTVKTDPYYPDYLGETAQPTFDQKVADTKINLMRIYINGCIDREIVLTNDELSELKKSLLQINPKSSDIDLYLFRVYNSQPLSHREVIKNYISFLPLKTGDLSKESIFNKNDILNDEGRISWEKCKGKVNTLLFIYHKDGRFPNRFWGQEDNLSDNDKNKKIPCTLVINYANPTTNVKYGGVLDKLQCKGQGSSAMRYLIWNVNSSLNKFKYTPEGSDEEKKAKSKFMPFGYLWTQEKRSDLLSNNSGVYDITEGYYPMPEYDGEQDKNVYKYTKMVGKVNFASSMQSHKIGACKLYDDAYKASLGTASLPSGGKKAVHEEPFMYFYVETDIPFDKNDKWKSELDCDSITYDKILELGNQAKFMGFQTWGPGKGDDACSGFDEDKTPHYLMLEGGENTDPSVNFQRPWQALQRLRPDFKRDGTKYVYTAASSDLLSHPTVTKDQSLLDPSAQLLIDDESIVYMTKGSWDIDYGFEEEEVGDTKYYNIPEGGSRESLKIFRDFYDTVYKWDFTCVFVQSTVTEPQKEWSYNKKYVVLSGTFKINNEVVSGHKPGDVYRFDEPSNSWVKAGVYYNNGNWERLNYVEEIQKETGASIQVNSEARIKDEIKHKFMTKMNEFLKLDDIAFHQAFIKFLSGTDNRAKNTYFQIIGPMYHEVDKIGEDGNPVIGEDGKTETEFVPSGEGDNLIRLIGDDLDTILVTDNNGLQSKPYNLLEDSYDESFYNHWGDVGNIFFRMFDICYETQIRTQLANIMSTASLKSSSVNDKSSYFYKQFFKVQEDFPEIAYNNTATIYYENAQLIKDSTGGKDIYGFRYTNNEVEPIEQSHGSCLQGEKQFMKERVAFLAGYAATVSALDGGLTTSSSAGGGKALKMKLDFIPAQDFYPTYKYENSIKQIGSYSDSNYDIIKYKAEAGKFYEQIINENSSAINQNLFQVDLYKTLSITGLQTNDINGNFASTTELIIDNKIITEDKTGLFGQDYPVLNLAKLSANLPVIEKLSLRNLQLPSEINLESFHKLQSIDLTGSTVSNVIFPQTGLFVEAKLPASIKTFEIYNNPKLSEVTFESTGNLETIFIDGEKCTSFDISAFCEELNATSLSDVTLRNLQNVYLTEEALYKLLVNKCELSGEITIVDTFGSTNPKKISFKTKQELVNKFGDIVTGTNGIKINFEREEIQQQFSCNSEASAFYDTKKGGEQIFTNLYGINIASGNNVVIVNAPNPFNESVIGYLDISYKLEKAVTNVSVDSLTGAIKLTGPTTETATVIITIKTLSGISLTNNTRISFAWKTPKIGDFAYADGTFSNYYNSSKTLVGLVYAKEGEDNEGTVYIIGKEYSNPIAHYSGYSSKGGNVQASENSEAYRISKTTEYMQSLLGVSNQYQYQPNGEVSSGSDISLINNINRTSSTAIMKLPMMGYEDTSHYINLVNTVLLPKLKSRYSYIKWDGGTNYYIDNIQDLNEFCEEINDSGDGSIYNSGLLYPYFYSAYLYQPSPKNGEELDEQYKQGSWYAPSVGELSRIIYYRGYSSGGSNFVARSCRQEVKDDITSGGEISDTPIFSLALKGMGQSLYPEVWKNIVGSGDYGTVNNITTTVDSFGSDADNYSYQVYTNYSGNTTTYESQWMVGGFNTGWSYDSQGKNNAWRYAKHQGIPFVKYNYVNPTL